jgi:hypothetical protein
MQFKTQLQSEGGSECTTAPVEEPPEAGHGNLIQ